MMKKPSLESLGLDLLHMTVGERVRCLTLPFGTCAGFFAAGHAGWWWVAAICAVLQAFFRLCGTGPSTHCPVAMKSGDTRGFFAELVGDGRPLILFTALVLALAGTGAMFLSVTGHFLPHDVDFLGMQPAALCELNQCRIVHFIGYLDPLHLAPAWAGAVVFGLGAVLSWRSGSPQ